MTIYPAKLLLTHYVIIGIVVLLIRYMTFTKTHRTLNLEQSYDHYFQNTLRILGLYFMAALAMPFIHLGVFLH